MSELRKEARTQVHEFVREAQMFLSGVRAGRTDQEAAEAAGVPLSTARAWLRDGDFAYHYERARRGEGGPQILSLTNYAPDERLRAVDAMLAAREQERLEAQERQLEAQLDECERQAQLSRYSLPETDHYGRLTDLEGWLG